MLKHMRILLIAFLACIHLPLSAQVYKTVDENGNIIFSDKHSENAEEVEIKEPLTIPPATNRNFEYTPQKKENKPYKKVEISSPKHDAAIRSNAGNVAVTVSTEPELLQGHKIVLYLDGKEYQTGLTTFTLAKLDRGTHSLRAVIKSSNGKQLLSSKTVSFHILRTSVLLNRPVTTQVAP